MTPTCFGSQRIHHQGVITCTLTEITCNGSQIFIVCVVHRAKFSRHGYLAPGMCESLPCAVVYIWEKYGAVWYYV